MKKSPKTKSARLAEKLLDIRSGLNLSQSEMLARLGFSDELFRSNVSQYERGTRVPPLPVLLAYARVAGVNVEDIIDDDLELPKTLIGAKKKKKGVKRRVKRKAP